MKNVILLMAGLLILCGRNLCWSQSQPESKQTAVEAAKAEDVGNKICPVSGDKIEEAAKAIYEYEGKVYNFCCAMCIDDFKKDPQKYIKKIEEEKAKEAAAVKSS
jgi:YHS domain-containing protein